MSECLHCEIHEMLESHLELTRQSNGDRGQGDGYDRRSDCEVVKTGLPDKMPGNHLLCRPRKS
jgi:hypothetical protein